MLNLSRSVYYNFRIAPEAVWFVINTVLGSILVDLIGRFAGIEGWPTLDTVTAWASAISFAAVRTLLGALLAVVTGGGFQKPGEPATNEPAGGATGDGNHEG